MEGNSGGNVEVSADYIVSRGNEIQRLLKTLDNARTEINSLIAIDESIDVFPESIKVWLIEIEKDTHLILTDCWHNKLDLNFFDGWNYSYKGNEIFSDKIGLLIARNLSTSNQNSKFIVDIKSTGLYANDEVLNMNKCKTIYSVLKFFYHF